MKAVNGEGEGRWWWEPSRQLQVASCKRLWPVASGCHQMQQVVRSQIQGRVGRWAWMRAVKAKIDTLVTVMMSKDIDTM